MLLLQHTGDIARQQPIPGSTTNGKQMTTLYTGVSCLCLPMGAVAAVQNGFDVGNAWNIYFEDTTDIKVGDRVTANGLTLIVRGKPPYLNLPLVSHIQVSAETEYANEQ